MSNSKVKLNDYNDYIVTHLLQLASQGSGTNYALNFLFHFKVYLY